MAAAEPGPIRPQPLERGRRMGPRFREDDRGIGTRIKSLVRCVNTIALGRSVRIAIRVGVTQQTLNLLEDRTPHPAPEPVIGPAKGRTRWAPTLPFSG